MHNNLEFIGKSANGKNVFNRPYGHIHKDVTKDILKEALSSISLTDDFHIKTINMKRIIGKYRCVPVTEQDEIVYVIRKGRYGPTPMVKNRKPIDSSFITLILKKSDNACYILISAFFGNESKPEPWDNIFCNPFTLEKRENIDEIFYQESLDFWNTHALIYDEDEIELHLS